MRLDVLDKLFLSLFCFSYEKEYLNSLHKIKIFSVFLSSYDWLYSLGHLICSEAYVIMIISDNKTKKITKFQWLRDDKTWITTLFKHFQYLLERNSGHSALSVSTSGLYLLPQYTVIDSVISDINANYGVCLFTLIVKIISIHACSRK